MYLFKQNDHNSNFAHVSSLEHDIMQLERSWEQSSTYSIQSSSFWKSRSRAAILFHFGLLVTIEYPWWNSSMYLECKQGCLWDTNNIVEYYSSRNMKNWRVSTLWLLTCNNLDEVFGIKFCLTLYMNARIILFPCFLSLTLPYAQLPKRLVARIRIVSLLKFSGQLLNNCIDVIWCSGAAGSF